MIRCPQCGMELSENTQTCVVCGQEVSGAVPVPGATAEYVGYSGKISDPAFGKYIKATNRWSTVIALALAAAAIIGFYIYGETGSGMQNPQALFMGIALAFLFLVVALVQFIRRRSSKTWDGVVVDKTAKKKSRRQNTGDDDYYFYNYIEYVVIVKSDAGKKHKMVAEDNAAQYNYFQIGDRVRHHAGLNSYEKYDKSKDTDILCNACSAVCSMNDDVCLRCKCPLLK